MPWFAISATTGAPINDASEYWDKCWDLDQARRHRFDWYDFTTGQTIFETFGKVTVTYTVNARYREGIEYKVKYVSDGGTILWFHTVYNRHKLEHLYNDTFTVYPPCASKKRRKRSEWT